MTTHPKGRMPGDLNHKEMIERMIRVDQAGEYGAVRIYKGQMAVLGKGNKKDLLQHMLQQEEVHLDTFNKMAAERRVRPTFMTPIWHMAGFALGAGTALLGKKPLWPVPLPLRKPLMDITPIKSRNWVTANQNCAKHL